MMLAINVAIGVFAVTGWFVAGSYRLALFRAARRNIKLHDQVAGLTHASFKAHADAAQWKKQWGTTSRLLGIAQRENHALRHGREAA
jgi:hypothetical protein